MEFDLYWILAGRSSPMTGGDDESFLKKVVTPIYEAIAKVLLLHVRLGL